MVKGRSSAGKRVEPAGQTVLSTEPQQLTRNFITARLLRNGVSAARRLIGNASCTRSAARGKEKGREGDFLDEKNLQFKSD
ncbi:MAG: hypothetical protein DMG35_15160 [Acidobacteria bacterium]|nr:MAG: hypothetical protein DMG35_15160 [Acidobacteriota bacterium]